MRSGWIICSYLIIQSLAISAFAQVYSPPMSAGIDAPELAERGSLNVGVKSLELVNPQQVDVITMLSQGKIGALTDRKLALQLWYPASENSDKKEFAQYPAKFSPNIAQDKKKNLAYSIQGYAIRDAQPVSQGAFPLVILSHGFNGDFSMMSYLGENLASKGYLVAAIDHYDFDASLELPQQLWFASALMNRAKDQAFVISRLPQWLKKNSPRLSAIVDPNSVGLIGYSMGGFGMMSILGAGLDPNSQTYKLIPGNMLAFLLDEEEKIKKFQNDKVKVAIAMAPWGAQKPFRSWSAQTLRKVKTPLLFIAGDRDDISQFEDGVKWLYDQMTASSRYLLVYQNARHNIGGNPAPEEAKDNYRLMEFFNEPVWRKERIVDINKHFVTAFLDWHLKGQKEKQAYFDVEHRLADEGTWPVALPEKEARFSGGREDASNTYWKGFKRRTALGLELHYKPSAANNLPSKSESQVRR